MQTGENFAAMLWCKNPRNRLFCLLNTFQEPCSVASQCLPLSNTSLLIVLCPLLVIGQYDLHWCFIGKPYLYTLYDKGLNSSTNVNLISYTNSCKSLLIHNFA